MPQLQKYWLHIGNICEEKPQKNWLYIRNVFNQMTKYFVSILGQYWQNVNVPFETTLHVNIFPRHSQ